MPSADLCRAVREDCSALSPLTGHPTDLQRYAVIPSVHRRRIDQVRRACGWRTLWWRAHSSRAYHTSDPVGVPRPARSFHAAFRPHLAVTAWRYTCPSAPRTPGRGTCTEHDRMHGTHAHEERRGKNHPQPLARPSSHEAPLAPRPLQCVVRPGCFGACALTSVTVAGADVHRQNGQSTTGHTHLWATSSKAALMTSSRIPCLFRLSTNAAIMSFSRRSRSTRSPWPT
jgi:hypothetical protein